MGNKSVLIWEIIKKVKIMIIFKQFYKVYIDK